MNLLKAKHCLVQIYCPFNYSCDAHIKFYPVLLVHTGIYMQIVICLNIHVIQKAGKITV